MNNLTYEKALMRLEEIVELLSSGSQSLDESMKLYEEGVRLSEFCENKIKSAEQKITELSKENENDR